MAKKNGFIITEYVYSVRINKQQNIRLSDEHTEFGWYNFDTAYNMLEKDNNRKTLKYINDKLLAND